MMKSDPSLARKSVRASLCLLGLCLPLTIAGANLSWLLLLISLVAYAAAGGRLPFAAHKSALEAPLVLYMCAAVLAALYGIDPARSILPLRQDAHKLWLYLLFSIGLALDPSEETLAFMALGFAAAATIGIFQTLCSLGGQRWDWVRAHAFVHPTTFGEQVAIAALGAFCFTLCSKEKTPVWRRRLAWILALLNAAALFLSNTRGAALGLAAGLAGIFLIRGRPTAKTAAGKLLLASTLAVAGFLAMELMRPDRSLISEIRANAPAQAMVRGQLMRLILWKAAWRMGKDHPWTGVGPNNYREALPRYFSGTFEDLQKTWGTAHNLYLHQFAERGLVGVAALGWLLGAFWGRALMRARTRPDAWNLWAFGTATAFMIMNVTEVALQTEILWMLVFFIWVWAEARHRLAPVP